MSWRRLLLDGLAAGRMTTAMLVGFASCAPEATVTTLANVAQPEPLDGPRFVQGQIGVIVVGESPPLQALVRNGIETWLDHRGYAAQLVTASMSAEATTRLTDCLTRYDITCVLGLEPVSRNVVFARVVPSPNTPKFALTVGWRGLSSGFLSRACDECSDPTWKTVLAINMDDLARAVEGVEGVPR